MQPPKTAAGTWLDASVFPQHESMPGMSGILGWTKSLMSTSYSKAHTGQLVQPCSRIAQAEILISVLRAWGMGRLASEQ